MVTGWRRAFCTSIPKDRHTKVVTEKQQQQCENTNTNTNNNQSPKITSKFGFFSSSSNPSTPRLQSQPVSTPSLRCRTTTAATAPTTPNSSLPNSPKLQCNVPATTTTPKKMTYSPRVFHRSNPSSPKSPSSFSLLKSTLRLNKSRCGICLQSVKSGQGTAIFTAECSHSFHFPCVATHVKQQPLMLCPVCHATWKELPLLETLTPRTNTNPQSKLRDVKIKPLRVYNDDEPLMSPTSGARFNPIPESDENEDENDAVEFQGFFVNPDRNNVCSGNRKSVEFSLLPESAVVALGRSFETYAVVLKVKAPQLVEGRATSSSRRAPIDLVTVVDVSANTSRARIQATKRALRLIISSLSDADRLSIVAFSSTSKRLLPLRRMTSPGRRSARRIVDALCGVGQGMCVNDALKKAAKVLQDRRERNPVASIMLLSDGGGVSANQKRSSPVVSSTRFPHLDIPVHTVGLTETTDDAFAKCVGGLLSVVVKDVKLQLSVVTGSANAEIGAVYSLTGRPTALGSGSIRLGDLYAGEERELLVELKVPVNSGGSHTQNAMMSVRSTYRDPSSNELVFSKERALLVPRSQAVRSPSTSSSNPNIQRLRNLHVTARAVAESRRFLERNDFSGAHHLLTSARALLLQSSSASAEEFLRGLEAELAELHRGRQHQSVAQRQRGNWHLEEKPEPLTPTSAWRAAERLAKVAIMRKSMNRVSDLHGFENARF
ncbi:putative chromatin regulator PHD family [Rosa chinensis]|uniref:Putative chromatin regulator PHD family n=1 Tax=Rosa chinensis TaxID=74649 RepID=A0A2P6RPJ6_ROSCH|nr:E3 ubiquitin-protein ligase WAVH1 [Rosa chinensis]PRQ48362.1 putative chromatin regulator PHD family [Rosa chinensis]